MLLNSLSLQATFDPVVSRALEHFSVRWSALFVLGGEQWVELSKGWKQKSSAKKKRHLEELLLERAAFMKLSRSEKKNSRTFLIEVKIPFLLYRELLINTRELIVDLFLVLNSFVRGASHHLRVEEWRRHAEEESFINHPQCLSNQKCNRCLRCEGKLERWGDEENFPLRYLNVENP